MTSRFALVSIACLAACGRRGFDPHEPMGDAAAIADTVDPDAVIVPVTCGDGAIDANEECDTAGASIGCTASCRLASQPAGGACSTPTMLTLVTTMSGLAARATGNTTGSTNTIQATCTPGNTIDHTFAVAVPSSGTLTVTITPAGWDSALVVRDPAVGCGSSTTICCVDTGAAGAVEKYACPVPAGTVQIVVEGSGGAQSGGYTLDVTVP